MMDKRLIEIEIEKCQISLAELNRMRLNMEEELHLEADDPAFDVLAEKGWKFVHRWEVLGYFDTENRPSVKTLIDAQYQKS